MHIYFIKFFTILYFIHLIVVFSFYCLFILLHIFCKIQVFSVKLSILLELTVCIEMSIITKYNYLLTTIHYAFMNEWLNSDYFVICHVILCYFCQLMRLTVLCEYVRIHGYLSLKRMRKLFLESEQNSESTLKCFLTLSSQWTLPELHWYSGEECAHGNLLKSLLRGKSALSQLTLLSHTQEIPTLDARCRSKVWSNGWILKPWWILDYINKAKNEAFFC